jgi:hypothetical protein
MQEWISGLVRDRYKTVSELAKVIGMTDSGFSRAARAGTFDVENCLKLAHETGQSPAVVFEIAGKAQINALIEQLYGKARPATDPYAEKAAALMTRIRDAEARDGFLKMMRGYLEVQDQAAAGTPAKSLRTRR